MACHVEVVGDASAGVVEPATHWPLDNSLNNPFHVVNASDCCGGIRCNCNLGCNFFTGKFDFPLVFVVVEGVGVERGVEWLAEFASIAVQSVGLQARLPTETIAAVDILFGCFVREVDGLGNCARDERLGRGHHEDVSLRANEPLAIWTATIRTVKDREVLVLQTRRTFDRLRATNQAIERSELRLGQPKCRKPVEVAARTKSVNITGGESLEYMLGHIPGCECELKFEHGGQLRHDGGKIVGGVALFHEIITERVGVS